MRTSITRLSRKPGAVALGLAAAALLLSSCATGAADSQESSATTDADSASSGSLEATGEPASSSPAWAADAPDLGGDLTVFAAASLNEVFSELGATMEEHFPSLTVTFSFASSTTLAEQLASGAPADVLATANESAMTKAGDAVVDPVSFASNTLVIVTAPDNPQGIASLADFANADLTLAVCAVEVPCGAASATAFEAGGITPSIDTYGENVTATLALVTAGEVDAALVYATDAVSAGDAVATVEFPESAEAVNTNWIALAADAPNPEAAAVFLALVQSEDGMAVLEAAGFGSP